MEKTLPRNRCLNLCKAKKSIKNKSRGERKSRIIRADREIKDGKRGGLKKIGELELGARRAFFKPFDSSFSQREQCKLLSLHRSWLSYQSKKPDKNTLQFMQAIDEEYLEHPFYGRRRMTIAVRARGL